MSEREPVEPIMPRAWWTPVLLAPVWLVYRIRLRFRR